MKILTAVQMQRIDRLTTERYGVPSLTLMENAGLGVVGYLAEKFAPLESHRIAVICGRGNNGGDGFVVARFLRERGLAPRVVLLSDPASLKGDAEANYQRLAASEAPAAATNFNEWQLSKKSLDGTTLLVDAILGTGLTRPVEGFLRDVICDINSTFTSAKIVAVDLPSGISADAGELIGDYVRCDAAVTFTAPKIAHVFPPACERIGDWVVKDIGTPLEALEDDPGLTLNLTTPEDLAWLATPRNRSAHKGDFGRVIILAGSVGKTGAAAMAAKAALRSGAGLVTVATARSALPIIASLGMEYMTEPLPETESGAVSLRALDYARLEKLLADKSVLALGPGMGTAPETSELIRNVVNQAQIPVVLDADGLNAFDGRMKDLRPRGAATPGGAGQGHSAQAKPVLSGAKEVPVPPPIVFTPHPGEMARLMGKPTAEIQGNRVEVARRFAAEYGVHLVLKGFRTLIAAPDGQVWVNPTGNPGMATGGTGDVLTGMIAGLVAQHSAETFVKRVASAVYLHGLAGDLAARELGEESMIAGDLLEMLPRARRASEEEIQNSKFKSQN